MKARSWLLAVGLTALACSQETAERAAPSPEPAPAQVVAAPVAEREEGEVAALRKLHARVDAAESPEQMREALARIEDSFRAPSSLPGRVLGPLRQDLACRAAQLELSRGHAEEARVWAERGLALAEGQPLFRANLLVTLADAERELERPEAAREHLVEALAINQRLLDHELEHP